MLCKHKDLNWDSLHSHKMPEALCGGVQLWPSTGAKHVVAETGRVQGPLTSLAEPVSARFSGKPCLKNKEKTDKKEVGNEA